MNRFKELFRNSNLCNVIGMIHIGPLPGTSRYEGSLTKLVEKACEEAECYQKFAVDGILLENMHDIPYIQSKDMGPEVTAVMTAVCSEVRAQVRKNIPCGVQVLAGANKEALAVALAADLQFIRAEGFIFSHVADEGWTDACAGHLLRYRHYIDADHILIFTDIKKKHSAHTVTADIAIDDTVKAAEFFLSDGVIITGTETGKPVDSMEFSRVRRSAKGPVLVGSGVTLQNLAQYATANALIIGSYFKRDGYWMNDLDSGRVKDFTEKAREYQYQFKEQNKSN